MCVLSTVELVVFVPGLIVFPFVAGGSAALIGALGTCTGWRLAWKSPPSHWWWWVGVGSSRGAG